MMVYGEWCIFRNKKGRRNIVWYVQQERVEEGGTVLGFGHNKYSSSALLPMKAPKEEPPKRGTPFSPDLIIEHCRQKFINILPNTLNRGQPKPTHSHDSLAISIMYRKDEVKQLIRQLSLFLQLVIQNYVLTSDNRVRSECIKLLNTFKNYLSRDLSEFQNLLCSRIKGRLPEYEIDCRSFTKRDLVLRMPPQISLYQDPLLFYIYSRAAQEELFCNHSVMMTRDERIDILKNHVPFFSPLFVPLVEERLETKAKFSEFEDRLLQIVISIPRRDMAKLKHIYFPNRPEYQIKNRIKNLCGNPKELHNPIKDMKLNQYLPLRTQEIQALHPAYARFGPRWPIISKYYQLRSADFLQAEFNRCEKLAKKRAKEHIEVPYQDLKEMLEGGASRRGKHEAIEVEREGEEESDVRAEGAEELVSEEEPPVFKVINNVTFLVQEI